MKNFVKRVYVFIRLLFNLPLYIPYLMTSEKKLIKEDLVRWQSVQKTKADTGPTRLLNMLCNRVFLSIYFHRIRCGNFSGWILGEVFRRIYRPLLTLLIYTREIGPGLFIQHGICTIIAARKIGSNVWVNQQVTIGYTNDTDCPTLGDNVTVGAGAKVLGDITIGDNVKIGANAVVVKNVPPDCVVVGVPARIVRRNGKRVDELL